MKSRVRFVSNNVVEFNIGAGVGIGQCVDKRGVGCQRINACWNHDVAVRFELSMIFSQEILQVRRKVGRQRKYLLAEPTCKVIGVFAAAMGSRDRHNLS